MNSKLVGVSSAIALCAAAFPAIAQDDKLTFSNQAGTEIELYGYVKFDAVVDFGAELGNTTFGLVGITDDDQGDFFNATAQQTRLGFRSTSQTGLGEFKTRVEIDFYGGAGAFGTENPFEPRVRHAYAELGGFRVGKNWTTFMPLASYPLTVDFQGVAGIPFARQEQIRYTHEMGNYVAEFALEEHNNETSDDPVAVAAFAYDTDPLLLRMSGIYGTVSDGMGGDEDVYGVNLSTTFSVWDGGTIDASYTYGEGIASYMVFLGTDVDTSGEAIEQQAAYVGLSQSVNDKLTLRAIYGYRENDRGAAGDTESLSSVHLNAEYNVRENTTVAIEYFHGTRDTFGGADFGVDRVQAAVTYNF